MRISQIVSTTAISFITGLIMSCSLNPAEEDPKLIIVNFTDPNFEALIREELEIPTEDITNQDMWTIQELDGANRNISDLTGIEYCSGLHTLRVPENNISDLSPLSELVLIDYLGLNLNQIVDIKPLVDNIGIGIGKDIIFLHGNPLSDESILTYKPQLQIRGVSIYTDLELSTPSEINFMDNNFETVIREHVNKPTGPVLNTDLELLTNIYARNMNISNIYGIEFCKYLDTLDIGENQISDIVPIFYLRGIESLKLDDNKIADIEPIRYFSKLTELAISNNIIQDITYFSNFTILKYLSISNNPIENFEPIENLDSLLILNLMDLYQFDFDHIKDIANLQTLYLTNTPIINLDPIANITSLKNLIAKNCSLSNIYPLANLNKLGKLILSDNNITDITSLSELYELWELQLDNNYISDILPLVINWGIGQNEYVLLYDNPLSEISINTYIPQLQDRGVNVIY